MSNATGLFGVSARSKGLALAAAAALLAGSSSMSMAFQDEGTLRIGMLESLTGGAAPYGVPGARGTLLAIEEANAAGGIEIDGKKVKIEVVGGGELGSDGGLDPAKAIANLKGLVYDDMVLMVKGPTTSTIAEATFNYLKELASDNNGLVVHSSSAGAPGLGEISEWGFRNSFAESYALGFLAEQVVSNTGAKTAGIYHLTDNPYFPAISELMKKELTDRGVEVKTVVTGLSKDADFSRQVNELRAADPDIVYVSADNQRGIGFMKEAFRRRLQPDAFIGGISQLVPDTIKSGGEATEGMVMVGSYDDKSDSIVAFGKKFKERWGDDINLFSVNGYEAGQILIAALEMSGIKNTRESLQDDRAKLREAYEKVSIDSISGYPVAFNDIHDTPKAGVILTIKDGAFGPWEPGQ
ncbi:MAG: ABC transporter substrate-binding protein [Alphaproteobacteria bacterium]|nr:ABC transporter substrate-binding protein [Alphaproteobacteria bacterium]